MWLVCPSQTNHEAHEKKSNVHRYDTYLIFRRAGCKESDYDKFNHIDSLNSY